MVELRERLQKLTQERKDAESKFNKMKAKNDSASSRLEKVQKDMKDTEKKQVDIQRSI